MTSPPSTESTSPPETPASPNGHGSATPRIRRLVGPRTKLALGVCVLVALISGTLVTHAWYSVKSATPTAPTTNGEAIIMFAGEGARAALARTLYDETGLPMIVSNGEHYNAIAPLCGQTEPVLVLCPTPPTDNTRGEAQMFGRIATEQGWQHLIAVTGDYHLARARTLLKRCHGGPIEFRVVEWGDRVPSGLHRSETLKLLYAHLVERNC